MIALYLGIVLVVGFGGGVFVGYKYGNKAFIELQKKYAEARAEIADWKHKIEDL